MKKVYILACLIASGAFVSCTNDDVETSDNKSATEAIKEVNPGNPTYANEGPGDDPIIVPPPPSRG